ncbi:MAG: polyribonucleotide nucleotidyltransferase [Brevinema sp.]
MFDVKQVRRKIGEQEIILETGRIARQAAGSVVIYYGGNAMLVTACAAPDPTDGDFFPLTVHFQEKFYAVGRIPGGFFRREAKPSDNATLMARQIDRPIRPLFAPGFKNEVQVIATLISSDMIYTTEGMGIVGAAAALAISNIPITEYAGGVKVAWSPEFGYKINPTLVDLENSKLDLLVGGTKEGICMVEGGGNEVAEEVVLEALRIAQEAILEEIAMIEELVALIKPEKMLVEEKPSFFSDEQRKEIYDSAYQAIKAVSNDNDKHRRSKNIKEACAAIFEKFGVDKEHEAYKEMAHLLEDVEVEIIRHQIVVEKVRTDGRQLTEIRPITIELDVFGGLHGSVLFTRGQTQSLGVVTLGMPKDEMLVDSVESSDVFTKRFMLHYNFPPFSVGEVKRLGGLSRREIGHGHLAERALIPVLPDYEKFPYTIRLVSEITESNGSSSMASVCSGSLSMMVAGVPLKAPVAGIAMGLVWDKNTKDYTILSDIQGLEDHHGDMDFKVAGTANGITAIQMDLKTTGLPEEIMKKALAQAKDGRMFILNKMSSSIDTPRDEVATSAPKLHKISIEPDMIGTVIGSGGRTIKKIMSEYGTDINIEDNGDVVIAGKDQTMIEATAEMIRKLTTGFREDEEITGPVTRVEAFGVFVEVLPGQQALLHKSRASSDLSTVKVGDQITVFFKNLDERKRFNVYQINKDVDDRPARPRREYGDRSRDDRPRREYGDRSREDRPRREYGDRQRDDRPRREYGDKPREDRPRREEGNDQSHDEKRQDGGHNPDQGF